MADQITSGLTVWFRRLAAAGVPLFGGAMPMILFLLLPLLSLLLAVSVPALASSLVLPQVRQAIQISVLTSLGATMLAIGFGLPLAYLLARKDFAGRRAIDSLIDLPMVLPPAVAGIALLLAFGRQGMLGGVLDAGGVSVAFTPTAVVLAQLFVASPYFIRAAALGFSQVDRELEGAAELDGASRWQVWWYVTLPLARANLVAGALMTWARALGEFGATIIFAGNLPGRTQTMPLAIYVGFELDLGVALTLSLLLMGLSFLVLYVVKRVLQQRLARF